MGACTTKSPPGSSSHLHRMQKKSNGTAATSSESPLKNHDTTKIAEVNVDQFFERYGIEEIRFKQLAASKGLQYYQIFYKLRMLSEQIGEIHNQGSSLAKALNKLIKIKSKVERDFRTYAYKPSQQGNLPISNDEILVYCLKYAQVTIDCIRSLRKEKNYEESYPILSFAFDSVADSLQNAVNDYNMCKESQNK